MYILHPCKTKTLQNSFTFSTGPDQCREWKNPQIESFNRFLKDQKSVEGQANITLMLFDTEFLKPINAQDIMTVNEITADRFEPRGATALLDAIGISIKETRKRIKALPEQEQPGKVIFAIFTDGYENSSRLYEWSEISAKIAKRTSRDGWEFLFLAANEDAIATASKLKINQEQRLPGRVLQDSDEQLGRKRLQESARHAGRIDGNGL